jgi:hypothetical protein
MLLPRLCAIAAVALMLPFYAVVAAHQVAADQGTTRPSLQQAAEALWNPTVSAYSSYEDEGAGELQKDSLCLRAVNLCGFAGGAR